MLPAAPLSFQLYSARNFPPLDAVLARLRELGYGAVEPYGAMYDDPAAFRAAIDRHGLAAPSAHIRLGDLRDRPGWVVETARTIGIALVACPFLMPDERPADAAGWAAFGRELAGIAARLKSEGLAFAWHNHDFEFAALPDGSVPMQHILAGGPDVLWEADAAWIVRGGHDPLEWIARHPGRIPALHVKDIAPAGTCTDEDGWADVGEGVMDWPALWRAAEAAGTRIFVAEHDNPSDWDRFARRSRDTMKRLAGRS